MKCSLSELSTIKITSQRACHVILPAIKRDRFLSTRGLRMGHHVRSYLEKYRSHYRSCSWRGPTLTGNDRFHSGESLNLHMTRVAGNQVLLVAIRYSAHFFPGCSLADPQRSCPLRRDPDSGGNHFGRITEFTFKG